MESLSSELLLPVFLEGTADAAVDNAGGLGFGGGVDLPKECFFGEAFSVVRFEDGGNETGCFDDEIRPPPGLLLSEFLVPEVVDVIFSELPFNFSRLLFELEVTTSSRESPFLLASLLTNPVEDGGRVGFFDF